MENARDQRLIWDTLLQGPLLKRIHVFREDPNVDAAVLLERRGRILPVALDFFIAIGNWSPLSGIDRLRHQWTITRLDRPSIQGVVFRARRPEQEQHRSPCGT